MYKEFMHNKSIVYWGAGEICKLCLVQHPEVNPVFFIDSDAKGNMLFGRSVKKPAEVEDWSELYIIITVKSDKISEEIKKILEIQGLKHGESFCSYKEIFDCTDFSFEDSLRVLHDYKNYSRASDNPIMLILPLEEVRNSKGFVSFISAYVQARRPSTCLIFSRLKVLSLEEAAYRLKCPVFCLPDIWDKENDNYEWDENLLDVEYGWIRALEERKCSSNSEKGIEESKRLFWYYKKVIEIIQPSRLISWGNWSRESYILRYLADQYGIPHGYMEHGWLPGTYQVDPRGIMGQSEFAVNPFLFEQISIAEIFDIGKVKQYIREKKLDTRIFIETEEDKEALKKIEKDKKTIFFVGMDDYGMAMNPESDYWVKYISSIVKSTKQALCMVADVCKKNNWNLIFKLHPSNPLPKLDYDADNIILVREMEIDRLLCAADAVVSIASAVDYKTLIYEKPLIQLGINGLRGKGCSYIVDENTTLEEQMKLALKNGMTVRQKENFDRLLQILLQRYLWDDMSDRTLRYGLTVERDFLDGQI